MKTRLDAKNVAYALGRALGQSESWAYRVYKRVKENTVREVVENRLWTVKGIPQLDDALEHYEVWKSRRHIACSCAASPWGYARRLCTHIGAVLTYLCIADTSPQYRIGFLRTSLESILRVHIACSPIARLVVLGQVEYTVIVCRCGMCRQAEVVLERDRQEQTIRVDLLPAGRRLVEVLTT